MLGIWNKKAGFKKTGGEILYKRNMSVIIKLDNMRSVYEEI